MAASMGTILLTAGTKGKRYALPHATIHLHQPLGGVQGQAADIEIEAREILRMRDLLNSILREQTKMSDEQIAKYTDRNMYLTAAQAVEVGLIDAVLEPQTKQVRQIAATTKPLALPNEGLSFFAAHSQVDAQGGRHIVPGGVRRCWSQIRRLFLPFRQLPLHDLLHSRRIGLAATFPHHLSDEKAQHGFFAAKIFFHFGGIRVEHPGHDGFDRAGIADLRQALRFHNRFGRLAGLEHLRQDALARVKVDRAGFHQPDQFGKLRGCDLHLLDRQSAIH